MKTTFESSSFWTVVFVNALCSVLPLVIINMPWWVDVIYFALVFFGLSWIAFPAVMVWAFVVEIQQPTHDWVGILFLIYFVLYVIKFVYGMIHNK